MRPIKLVILLITFFVAVQNTVARSGSDSTLNVKERSIISIASLTAKGDLQQLKKEIDIALQSGLTVNEIKEVQVHVYAYCGFPRSIRGLQTLMQVIEERKSKGTKDVIGREASMITDGTSKYERGRITLSKLTNTKQERPSSGYGAFAPIIDTFLKEHLFADIFDRDILTQIERELATISVLGTIGSAEPMLRNHYSICLNLGISPNKLYEFTEIIKNLYGNESYLSCKKTLDELLNRKTVASSNSTQSHLFDIGAKITNSNFQGTAYLNNLVTADSLNTSAVGSVTFEPGARTKWHMHPAGQILLVIEGVGYYQEKGQQKRIIKKGDVIKCQPNLPHWHGASATNSLVQIAITNRHLGETVWMDEVTNQEYNK